MRNSRRTVESSREYPSCRIRARSLTGVVAWSMTSTRRPTRSGGGSDLPSRINHFRLSRRDRRDGAGATPLRFLRQAHRDRPPTGITGRDGSGLSRRSLARGSGGQASAWPWPVQNHAGFAEGVDVSGKELIVVGIDPDSRAHGVAIYRGGQLVSLSKDTLLAIHLWLEDIKKLGLEVAFCIENVLAQNFVYTRNAQANKAAHAKVALSIGRCQQAQEELMRFLDHHGVPYQTVKPTAGNWAKDRDTFERITGWSGKSNEDTRSAAYFGWLGLYGRKTS